jgi:hypothetical protein
MFVSCECCVLSGRGNCDGPSIRSEEFYRMCVSLRVIRSNNNPVHLRGGKRGHNKEKVGIG